uniref:Uncharacterized protein n=1 Tax=Anopheles coluzzii TaxID=1518534 RepID=A0A8W7PNQ8_ANOCL
MDARAEQDASCDVVEPQQQLSGMSGTSPGRRVSVVEDAAKDEVASQSASLSHGMEVKKKRLEILRKKFEVEKAQKELELQLCELELEEEICDHHSRISKYAEKTEIWMRETDHISQEIDIVPTPTPVGIGPTTVGSTRVATAAAVSPQRSEGAMAKADRGHQPSTPASASVPPDYDRTMAVEQAAAMELGPTRPVVRRRWDQPARLSVEDGTNPPGCPPKMQSVRLAKMGPTRLGVRRGWDQPARLSVKDGNNPPGCPPKWQP